MAWEEWRPVRGFEGYYEVSSLGRVRGIDRIVRREDGTQVRRRGQMMRAAVNRGGYRTVHLRRDGQSRLRTVHSMVSEAFHGPRPEGNVVRHLNGDHLDNRAENLAWGTYSENARDIVKHGRNPFARREECKHGHALTEENVYLWRGARYCRTCRSNNNAKRVVEVEK